MLKDFHASLYLHFQARDQEEAIEIARICKEAIEKYERQPYKVSVDIGDVEEA